MPDSSEMMKEIVSLQQRLDELRAALRSRILHDSPPEGEIDLFVCRVHDDRVGLPLGCVDEVLPMCALTSLPEAPDWLPGVLNLRGSAIPVIDVLGRAERRRRDIELDDFIVICTSEGRRFGLVVQQVHHIARVDGADLQTVPEELPLAPYVLGLFQIDGATVFFLSLSCLLSTSEVPEGSL